MALLDDLNKIKDETIADSENWNINDFDDYYTFMSGSVSESVYIFGTPLMDFRKKIEDLMNKTGFEYIFNLIGIYETCDGECYEFAYELVWYDKGLNNFIFNFATLY